MFYLKRGSYEAFTHIRVLSTLISYLQKFLLTGKIKVEPGVKGEWCIFFKEYPVLKKSLIILLILNAFLFAFVIPILVPYILTPPISKGSAVSLSISPPGSVEHCFHVNWSNEYFLYLYFRGDRPLPPSATNNGVPIPIYLEISSLTDGRYVFQDEIIANRPNYFSPDYVERFVESIYLKPGDYKLVMHITKDVPEFTNFYPIIGMHLSQMAFENIYILPGYIGYLLLIIDGLFLLILFIRYYSFKYRVKKNKI